MARTYRLSIFLPLLLLVFFSGCVETEDQAGVFKATYAWWVGASAMLGGILLTIGGWFWKQDDFRGWIFFIAALLATVTFLPFGFVDHVTITDERLSSQWGFWVYPTTHEIEWDDVNRCTLTKKSVVDVADERMSAMN